MERITEAELYAELIAAHRKPPPISENDITVPRFAKDTGFGKETARRILLAEVDAGRMVIVKRMSKGGQIVNVFQVVTT